MDFQFPDPKYEDRNQGIDQNIQKKILESFDTRNNPK